MKKETKKPNINEKQVAHNDELAEIKEAYDKYGKNAVTILLAVMVAVAATQFYVRHNENKKTEASAKLTSARSIPDLEALVAGYSGTPSAKIAELTLAKQYFDTGNYKAAITTYEKFIAANPDSPMLKTAELGRIFCIEAEAADDEALKKVIDDFAAFINANPDSFLVPQAIFEQARCLEHLKEFDDARILYEDFIAAETNSPWLPLAEERLHRLNSESEQQNAVKAQAVTVAQPAIDTAAATATNTAAGTITKTADAKVEKVTAPQPEKPAAVAEPMPTEKTPQKAASSTNTVAAATPAKDAPATEDAQATEGGK